MNPNVVPVLLNQIAAYEQNYIVVETLLEESKARAQALESVEKMKAQLQEVREGREGGRGERRREGKSEGVRERE